MTQPLFVAFDLETTGLDPEQDQILQIGAVAFTPQEGVKSEFSTLVRHARYEGDAFALQMNAALLKRLAAGEGVGLTNALQDLGKWLSELRGSPGRETRPYAVGFNVSTFDLLFLRSAVNDFQGDDENFDEEPFRFSHRVIELGTLLMSVCGNENGLPVSSNYAVREILGKEVAHDALEDARDAAALYLHWWKNR